MRQNNHAKKKRKEHVKIWIVMTVIMLLCFAGCQAKNITGVGKTKDPVGTKTGNNGDPAETADNFQKVIRVLWNGNIRESSG